MSLKTKIILGIVFVTIISVAVLQYYQWIRCDGRYATLVCFKKNSLTAHQNEENIFTKASEEAMSCQDLKKTASYLGYINGFQGGASTEEYLEEDIEDLFIKNSQCFLGAMLLLDAETQKIVLNTLNGPSDNQEVIKMEAIKYSNDAHYNKILQPILDSVQK